MTPDAYCRNKVARSGSSFYYSFLFLSEERRKAIQALYAFCREVDDAVDECHEPAVARVRLEWWRGEINNAFHGHPQHPVAQALAPAVARYSLPEAYFHEIIDGMLMDLERSSYPDFDALALYCYRAAGVVGLLSAGIFGYEDPKTARYAERLGTALQLINILRDLREDARRGRCYIPQDELARFGVTFEDLTRGETTEAMRALCQFQAERAREWYRSALTSLPDSDRYSQRSGLIMASIYAALLDEIEDDGFRILEHRVQLTPMRKLWIAWRMARREARRHRKWQRTRAAA